jgi:5-methylcytosine-specific restriction endonuclease McrA
MKKEVRQKVLIRDFYTCQVCGDTPGPQNLQIAHRMANTVEALDMLEKMFPDRSRRWLQDNVLDHPHNLVTTCSLSCNDSCNILKKPVECAVVIDKIMSEFSGLHKF